MKPIETYLRFSYLEALLTSLVVGFAENYFAAFSLQQGNSALQSGLLISCPLIFAAGLQFFVQSRLRTKGLSAFVNQALVIQSLALLGLAFVSLMQSTFSFFYLLFFYSIYWFGHFSIQPAWNRWISEIIPFENGQLYFSIRTRISQVGIVAGLIAGGFLLNLNVFNIQPTYLFLSLFLFCFLLKLGVIYMFKKHPTQTRPLYLKENHIIQLWNKNKFFLTRYGFFQTTIFISAPFVAGYLLVQRQLNYLDFMIVMSGLFLGKILTTYLINQTKKTIDPHKILFYGGLLAAPLPILWPFCRGVGDMFWVHVLSGIGWAGWEVGISLSFFKKTHPEHKIEMISLYNYVGILTQVLGTLIGAMIFKSLFKENFHSLFYVAGIIRLIGIFGLQKSSLQI